MTWRRHAIHARLDGADPDVPAMGRLVLRTVLFRVPSTAGGAAAVNIERRARAFEALRGLGHAMEPSWRVSLLADHSVSIEAKRDLPLPASAVNLLTQVTCFLLDLAPYLDWVDEMELASPVRLGTKNTWPG